MGIEVDGDEFGAGGHGACRGAQAVVTEVVVDSDNHGLGLAPVLGRYARVARSDENLGEIVCADRKYGDRAQPPLDILPDQVEWREDLGNLGVDAQLFELLAQVRPAMARTI